MYEDYLKKMKDECLLRNRAEGTYNTYENHVIKFLEWVKKNPDEVTLEDARMFFATPKYLKMQTFFPKVAAGNSSFLHVSPA